MRPWFSSELSPPRPTRKIASGALALLVTLTSSAGAASGTPSTSASPAVSAASQPREFLTFVTVRYVKVRGAYEERGTIWTANLDGSNRRQLARGNYPDISPDGRWVAFLDWAGRLRIVPSGGGPARIVARGPKAGGGFVWAPDSRRMAIASAGSLFVVDVQSRRRVRIDRAVDVWGMSFSPSGTSIVWGRKTGRPRVRIGDVDLFRASIRGGGRRRLTRDRGSESPVWGRPGIAFARFKPFTSLHPPTELWFVRPDGTGERRISDENLVPFAWSEDGRRLLATVSSEVDTYPMAVEPTTGTTHTLLPRRGEVFTAAFSRDGRWVLVVANGRLLQVPWSGGRSRVLARGVDEAADWTR